MVMESLRSKKVLKNKRYGSDSGKTSFGHKHSKKIGSEKIGSFKNRFILCS